jgi:hypothetical protein
MSVREADDSDLADLAHWLVDRYGHAAPTLRSLWEACAGGRVPAYRVGRHWRVPLAARPAVAAYFKLIEPPPASTPDQPQHAA